MRLPALLALVLSTNASSAHDWYVGKTDPVTQGECCNGIDCRAVDAAEVEPRPNGGYLYLPRQWEIPRERVQGSPDGLYHICDPWKPSGPVDTLGRRHQQQHRDSSYWTCFFAPRQVSALEGD